MVRRKKPEEHENLERWMVSYADFLTLLFATFVVLYALSQINLEQFKNLQLSMKKAFSAPSILQGEQGVLNQGKDILDSKNDNSMIDSLMLEYVSPAYEQDSFEQIKKDIEALNKTGELKDVTATIDERGLVIKINDNDILFKSGSADLSNNALKKLDIIGKLIIQKFAMHQIRIEGHADSVPSGGKYPSNWELSSARASSIVRYLITKFQILPDLFSAVGYAETRPVDRSNSKDAMSKNRRVEIIVLRSKNKKQELNQDTFLKMNKEEQQKLRNAQIDVVKDLENKELSAIERNLRSKTKGSTDAQGQNLPQKEKAPSHATANDYWKETDRINNLK